MGGVSGIGIHLSSKNTGIISTVFEDLSFFIFELK